MKKSIITACVLAVFLCGCRAMPRGAKTSADGIVPESIPTPEPERTVVISCAGDCTLGTDVAFGGRTFPVEVEAQNNDYSWFFRNVKPIFESDDLTIVNFEGTLTTRGTRQDKTYAFRGEPEYVKVLTEGGVEAATLANNHSVDYGEVSLADTKLAIGEAGIIWFENLNTAVTEINGVKVGLIGLYDLNRSAADVLPKAMAQVRADGAELVIVQAHWGIEGDAAPCSAQRSLAHNAIDAGADVVIGHHPHVIQGLEEYKGKMIVYSLGNFCFGGNQNPKDKDCMIFRQKFSLKDGVVSADEWCVYPCSVSSVSDRNNYQPTVQSGENGERIKRKIIQRTDSIENGLTINFGALSAENR